MRLSAVYSVILVGCLTAGPMRSPLAMAQTCCSGGVPLSGNVGFTGSEEKTLQLDLSYDLNLLSTLKNGNEEYTDEVRHRITHSLLLKSGYTFTRWLAVDALFSFVRQERKIGYGESVDEVTTMGLGDAVVIGKFIFSRVRENGTGLQVGAGPKIPIGKSDLKDHRGISLNADLQPGSGSWDLITWAYVTRQLSGRPTASVSARIVGRLNGRNTEYLQSQTYRFGNSFQLYAGYGDQVTAAGNMLNASISLRYRKALPDKVNGNVLDNTGGEWISLIPAIGFYLGTKTVFSILPEIPLYGKVTGTQLSPTFRIQAGFYRTIGNQKKNTDKQINFAL